MRSNDEFIKNIYKKRDKAVKKRKQKITAAVSGFCVAVVAIVCTSAVTSWVRDKSDVPVKSKSETVDADKRATEIADAEGTFTNNSAFEAVPEIGFAPDGIPEGENDDEYMVLTDVYTGPAFGFDGAQEEFPEDTCTEIALETGVAGLISFPREQDAFVFPQTQSHKLSLNIKPFEVSHEFLLLKGQHLTTSFASV